MAFRSPQLADSGQIDAGTASRLFVVDPLPKSRCLLSARRLAVARPVRLEALQASSGFFNGLTARRVRFFHETSKPGTSIA